MLNRPTSTRRLSQADKWTVLCRDANGRRPGPVLRTVRRLVGAFNLCTSCVDIATLYVYWPTFSVPLCWPAAINSLNFVFRPGTDLISLVILFFLLLLTLLGPPLQKKPKSLSTLSQKRATVAEFRRCLAVFGDSRTFLRQCGQGLNDKSDRVEIWQQCSSRTYV